MKSTYEYRRLIKATDRATLLNFMKGLNAYTLCSGIICEELNGSEYLASTACGDRENAHRICQAQGGDDQSYRRNLY